MSEQQPTPSHHYRRPSLFWPIILIGAGVILLLYNLGLLQTDPWLLLWNLWPVILIIIGLDILLGRRSIAGGIVSAIFALLLVGLMVALLFVAQNYPALIHAGAPELRSEHIAYPLGDVRYAEVSIDFPGGTGELVALEDSPNLIEGQVYYYGALTSKISVSGTVARVQLSSRYTTIGARWWTPGQAKWILELNPRAEYDLTLTTGSGTYEFDLRSFILRSLELDSGSGAVRLTLPESGQYRCKIQAGSGKLNIHVPEGVAVRVEYDAGSGALDAPTLRKISGGRDGVYESEGFSQSSSYAIIRLEGGAGDITIR